MSPISLRLRNASDGLLALPWSRSLEVWPEHGVDFRDLPVGASRHVVRFVEVDGATFALKELPEDVAAREYEILRELERREFPAVRPVGLVDRGGEEPSILVSDYLPGSFQYRRLFQRLPPSARKHRDRLLDGMAWLVVDLHRNGVFWGDCSLSNTLFRRDGQALQAFLVDAETSEIHPVLSDGQRAYDLEILVENVAGDLADIGAQIGRPEDLLDEDFEAAERVAQTYQALWEELHREETVGPEDHYRVAARVRRLNELGFAVDEVSLNPDAEGPDRDRLRVKVTLASRRFHATELRRLTGLDVGEGQATILLNDLHAYRGRLERQEQRRLNDAVAAALWLEDVVRPALARLSTIETSVADPIQLYCDLLEVRWLLSEEAGQDVGDDVAIDVLRSRGAPVESAAGMAGIESPTAVFDVSEWLGGRS